MEVHWERRRGKRVSRGRKPFTGSSGHKTDWQQHTDSPHLDNFTTGKQTRFKPCSHKRGGKSKPSAATPQFAEGINREELKQVPSSFSHSRRGRRQHTASYIPVQKKERWTPPVLSVHDIFSLSKLNSKELVTEIDNQLKAFQITLAGKQGKTQISDPNILEAVVRILSKLAKEAQTGSHLQGTACKVLAEVLSFRCEHFHWQLKQYVEGLRLPQTLRRPLFTTSVQLKTQELHDLFRILLSVLPASSWSCLPVDELKCVVEKSPVNSALLNQLNQLVEYRNKIRDDHSETKRSEESAIYHQEWDNSEFQQIPILPEWEEICTSGPPTRLRPNIVEGCYKDWMHYYDVQFRLLREDFIAPLRRGICGYLQGLRGRELRDVKIYNCVRIHSPVFTRNGICFELHFDISHLQEHKWEHSKRLCFGSLLCLSCDNFKDVVLFATVANRDPKDLRQGNVQVKFEDSVVERQILPFCKNGTSFVMVESMAYFEASRHILRSLQKAEVDTMPFTQYLIRGDCSIVRVPKYLGDNSTTVAPHYVGQIAHVHSLESIHSELDLGSDDSESVTASFPGTVSKAKQVYNLSCLYGTKKRSDKTKLSFNILDKTQWPCAEEIELDQSQLEAIQMGLTQEIAVIQGPPGTGKTYIGLKIVEALLNNRRVWDPQKASPILVMCYTNHALDQFLEGILQQEYYHEEKVDRYRGHMYRQQNTQACLKTPKIVRIGKRSRNEKVSKYNIEEVARQTYIPRDTLRNFGALKEEIDGSVPDILKTLKNYFNPCCHRKLQVLNLRQLRHPVADPEHFYQLKQIPISKEQKGYEVEIWLQLWEEKTERYTMLCQEYEEACKATDTNASPTSSTVVQQIPGIIRDNGQKHNTEQSIPNAPVSGELASSENFNSEQNEEDLVDVQGDAAGEELARMLSEDVENFKPIVCTSVNSNSDEESEDEVSSDHSQDEGGKDDTEQLQNSPHKQNESDVGEESEAEPEEKVTQPRPTGKPKPKPKQKLQRRENADILIRKFFYRSFMSEEEASQVENITTLSLHDRWRLHNYWARRHYEYVNTKNFKGYTKLCQEYDEACKEKNKCALEAADVIGMTTTGAAKYQHILHFVKPKIVIVEEAAEVLESHIVSALSAGTQHLILIGDHKQLKPKPNEYELAKRFKLDVSLFERLVTRKFPHTTLQIQHRMRPEIAQLVCPHIYKTLINHESVLQYRGIHVKGVSKDLFFIQHDLPESEDANLMSHSNEHEAKFIVALCSYLLQQGYKPDQITVLTPYVGQVLRIRNHMPRITFEGVRLTAVDNFQGEENDIILLSLVRSNAEGKLGFLKEENRVCVSLSRAKIGFYCIGNFKMLRQKSYLWETIMSDMEQKGYLGDALPLHCYNHPKTTFEARLPADFGKNAPTGGCLVPCEYRLHCGHVCTQLCHPKDPEHKEFKCMKDCARKCKEGHEHPQHLCHEECPRCKVRVERVMNICCHKQWMFCYEDLNKFKCKAPCESFCDAETHQCKKLCYQQCDCRCQVQVTREIPKCGHRQRMFCWQDPLQFRCKVQVEREIPKCGHMQDMACWQDPNEFDCKFQCERSCKNGHLYTALCHEDPNEFKCEVHVIKEIPKCGHVQEMACWYDPLQYICTKPCEKKQECGHPCPNKCGERCSIASCIVEVEVPLHCGHTIVMPCNRRKLQTFLCWTGLYGKVSHYCSHKCEKTLPCGHPCKEMCGKPCTSKCQEVVRRCWPCGHTYPRKCFEAQDLKSYPCRKKCHRELPCGHNVRMMCGAMYCTCPVKVVRTYPCGHVMKVPCSSTPETMPCDESCSQELLCGHKCSGKCQDCYKSRLHEPCPYGVKFSRICGHSVCAPCEGLSINPCRMDFTASCALTHNANKCKVKCPALPSPCSEPCEWNCPHYQCSKQCHEICDRPPCNKPCENLLACGHKCASVCGEPCIQICPDCNPEKFREKLQGSARPRAKKKGLKKDLRKEIYIQLDCRHIFPVEFLDQYMEPKVMSDMKVAPKQCPICHMNIRTSFRYGNATKRCLEEVCKVREIVEEYTHVSDDKKEEMQLMLQSALAQDTAAVYRIIQRLLKGPEKITPEVMCYARCIMNTVMIANAIQRNPLIPIALMHQFVSFSINFASKVHIITQRENWCSLSPQLLADFRSEQHRVCLTAQWQVVKELLCCESPKIVDKLRAQRAVISTERFLKSYNENHFLRVSDADYDRYSTLLNQIYPNNPASIYKDLHDLHPPPLVKGEWFKCREGHYYCRPPRTPEYHCPHCK